MGTISLNRGGFLKGAVGSGISDAGNATTSSSVNEICKNFFTF